MQELTHRDLIGFIDDDLQVHWMGKVWTQEIFDRAAGRPPPPSSPWDVSIPLQPHHPVQKLIYEANGLRSEREEQVRVGEYAKLVSAENLSRLEQELSQLFDYVRTLSLKPQDRSDFSWNGYQAGALFNCFGAKEETRFVRPSWDLALDYDSGATVHEGPVPPGGCVTMWAEVSTGQLFPTRLISLEGLGRVPLYFSHKVTHVISSAVRPVCLCGATQPYFPSLTTKKPKLPYCAAVRKQLAWEGSGV